jgi:hypothetical protein
MAALVAAVLAFLPALVTAIASHVDALARFRATEVATGIAGAVAAFLLWIENRDTAALMAVLMGVIPAIVTALVVGSGTVAVQPLEPRDPEAGFSIVGVIVIALAVLGVIFLFAVYGDGNLGR